MQDEADIFYCHCGLIKGDSIVSTFQEAAVKHVACLPRFVC